MVLPLVVESVVWYGPATATFDVQFAGDPLDSARNEVHVIFVGERNQREERPAYFDAGRGEWRSTLYTRAPGSYKPLLVRNGVELKLESREGLVEPKRSDAGHLVAGGVGGRLRLDTGDDWIGLGADLGETPTAAKVVQLETAGATWVSVRMPATGPSEEWSRALDVAEARGVFFTMGLPAGISEFWRRYAVARFGESPRLIGWVNGPSNGTVAPPAQPWSTLFRGGNGPFLVPAGDEALTKALHVALFESGWRYWDSPRPWHTAAADGVGESDRMIVDLRAGATPSALPLADGTYDLQLVDPVTGDVRKSVVDLRHGTISVHTAGESFLVLRRRIG